MESDGKLTLPVGFPTTKPPFALYNTTVKIKPLYGRQSKTEHLFIPFKFHAPLNLLFDPLYSSLHNLEFTLYVQL
jgi:hypothetical protein